MYPSDLVESVLTHSDIVDVISTYLNVVKKGKEYKAVCPFHADTDPSLMISKEKQIYKCFVCGAGGNAINFVRTYEKISFDEAVKKVAEISGYSDPRLLQKIKKVSIDPSLEPIYACIDDLQKYYIYGLSLDDAKSAREYLEARNIKDDQIKKYGVGFSPIDGEATIKFLQAKGHSLKAIEGTGVALAGTHSKDHNCGRITFPLCDIDGQVVGFSARRIIEDDTGKYVNSPEGPIFHKSNILYNYHRCKDSAKREGYVYVLEGFMDVFALDRAGIPNAIAIMGTALTNEQIDLLKKLKCEVRLCLDGDAAGQRAMMKCIANLQKSKIPFRIVSNPKDLRDPDEILQEDGPEKLKEMMSNLVDATTFQLSYYLNTKKLETLEERKTVLQFFLPSIISMEPGIEKDDFIEKLAKATGFEASAIYKQINGKTSTGPETKEFVFISDKSNRKISYNRLNRLNVAEEHVLFYMLKELDAIKYFESNIESFYNKQYEAISNYILDYYSRTGSLANPSVLMGNIESSEEENADQLVQIITALVSKDKDWPIYSENEIEKIGLRIREEKQKIYERLALSEKLDQSGNPDQSKALDEYISKKKVRENWNKK